MADYHIIDRRENPKGKNLSNRQKFLKKVRKHLNEQVRGAMNKKSITDSGGTDISVPTDGINEPSFDYDRKTGEWDKVLPGNDIFSPGDKIKKPPGSGSGSGTGGGADGSGEDSFNFTITRAEYLDIVFEDLELPDLMKTSEKAAVTWQKIRAGYKTDGSPSQLDLVRSLKNSLGRRLALRKPVEHQLEELEDKLSQGGDAETLAPLIDGLKRKRAGIPWVDPIDLRYRRWDKQPVPNSQAVMFCLMDVSASMGDREKEIAKRFYLLLYLFLERRYEKVQVVFVRHTQTASEVDEQEFFYGKETGGTVVSTGIEKINKIIEERYPVDAWNIYVVQSSDGDNSADDGDECQIQLHKLLPLVQYYVYVEVKQANFMYGYSTSTDLWKTMEEVVNIYNQLVTVNIASVDVVVDVFRKVFAKKDNTKK